MFRTIITWFFITLTLGILRMVYHWFPEWFLNCKIINSTNHPFFGFKKINFYFRYPYEMLIRSSRKSSYCGNYIILRVSFHLVQSLFLFVGDLPEKASPCSYSNNFSLDCDGIFVIKFFFF